MDFKNSAPLPRRADGIIERTQKAFFVREQFRHFLLVPQMVAAGDDIHAGVEDFPGGFGGDAGAAGGVLAVGDDEIERVLFAEFRQKGFDRIASRLTDDVADEEQFHAGILTTKA